MRRKDLIGHERMDTIHCVIGIYTLSITVELESIRANELKMTKFWFKILD
jgi:hypothetical protein